MQFDPEQGRVDWDGLFTFFITLVLFVVTLGLSLFISLRYVYRIAKGANCKSEDNQLLAFGKRLDHGSIDQDYERRLSKTAQLMREEEDRQLLLLGGSAKGSNTSEAQAGQEWLASQGIDVSRMSREERSQNTLENLRHARVMLSEITNSRVTMISNRYHLPRIATIAGSLGIDHHLCACETKLTLTPMVLFRLFLEAWYILWFKTGRSWARITRNQRMLDRVT
jgi:uncharacterized SAM-binding protein YcdF (DUF218 family)